MARNWTLNPADVMRLPAGLLVEMDKVLRDEAREQRRRAARAKTRGRR